MIHGRVVGVAPWHEEVAVVPTDVQGREFAPCGELRVDDHAEALIFGDEPARSVDSRLIGHELVAPGDLAIRYDSALFSDALLRIS